jgi:hypothetical protein
MSSWTWARSVYSLARTAPESPRCLIAYGSFATAPSAEFELASASRSHGIGILFDGAAEDDQRVVITLRTDKVEYALRFDLTSGRIDPSPGERLTRTRPRRS